MKTHRTGFRCSCIKIIAVPAFCASLLIAPCALAETITCDETTLSVNVTDIKAEDLIKAVGNECGIKIVLRGEVFTEDVFSVQFQNMPIRTGLERILRVVNIPNHMMHFEETNSLNRLTEVDLIGEKGGERQLTSGAPPVAPKQAVRQSRQARPQTKKPQRTSKKTELTQEQEEEQQEKVMELLEDILDTQSEDGEEPDPTEVKEMLQEALPEEMQGQIPAEVLEALEQLNEE